MLVRAFDGGLDQCEVVFANVEMARWNANLLNTVSGEDALSEKGVAALEGGNEGGEGLFLGR
jgi:hypothetical protein